MNIVVLTNDNFFSFTVLRDFLILRKKDIKLVVFSSALIGRKGRAASIMWSLSKTGFRHTAFKLMVYGIFRIMKMICRGLPFIQNRYSSALWAQKNNIACVRTDDVNSPQIVKQIQSAACDLVISVSMNQIVREKVLNMPAKGCINVHCAPLPRYGGLSPYVWVLANNEDHSAVTIHYMQEGLDEGDIIVQEKVGVARNDSAFALFYRCCLRAAELLPEVVNKIEQGTVISVKQNLAQRTYFSWPDRQCVKKLHENGYCLARTVDFVRAIFKQNRVRL